MYPVITPFCCSFGTGVHESVAVVGDLWQTFGSPGLPGRAGREVCAHEYVITIIIAYARC